MVQITDDWRKVIATSRNFSRADNKSLIIIGGIIAKIIIIYYHPDRVNDEQLA
jgi:hypothetical protein